MTWIEYSGRVDLAADHGIDGYSLTWRTRLARAD